MRHLPIVICLNVAAEFAEIYALHAKPPHIEMTSAEQASYVIPYNAPTNTANPYYVSKTIPAEGNG